VTPAYRRCAIKTSKETVSQPTGWFTTATQVPEAKANLVIQGRSSKDVRSGVAYLRKQYNEYGRMIREVEHQDRINRAPETFYRLGSYDSREPGELLATPSICGRGVSNESKCEILCASRYFPLFHRERTSSAGVRIR
jgi:hypothetical protein